MRCRGAATVFFSLVFMLLFGFIISFFEMAAKTARASYHASASLLAVENYFAAYLEPLYSRYHIFGREVPEGEDIMAWTEDDIAGDVLYMTQKRDGEKSLMLRSGADFSVSSVKVLTDNKLEGFYTQAITAMKYRGVLEIADMIKEFAGMTKQSEAHLKIAAAKAEADKAYGAVDEKILGLIELIDGVDIKSYIESWDGKCLLSQKDAYVKYFCPEMGSAAAYFDRTEVYRAFLGNSEDPCHTLSGMINRTETLVKEMKEREEEEKRCRVRLWEIAVMLEQISLREAELQKELQEIVSQMSSISETIEQYSKDAGADNREIIKSLAAQVQSLSEAAKRIGPAREECEKETKALKQEKKETEGRLDELKKKKKGQEEQAEGLAKEEEGFISRCKSVNNVCEKTYPYVDEVREELKRAKRVKQTCEETLDMLQGIIGKEAAEEYRKELEAYSFYKSPGGYDFEKMKQTVSANGACLSAIRKQFNGVDIAALDAACEGLKAEKEMLRGYSFEGLRLDYGDISLEENPYEGIESLVSNKVEDGFLGFLTERECSEKVLDTSYLPSGFRCEEKNIDIFSLLGTDISGVFKELQNIFPADLSFDSITGGITDAVLFHSYLITHFSDFLKENKSGALSYEQEYLIAGKATDTENLFSVAMRICAIRTVLHFISLYTDSERKAPVEQAALAACGIIGLPALKSIVVVLLLFVWASIEAMIDTAAFLMGKKLALYPGKTGGSLSFPEILLFSKSFILEKAEKKTDKKGIAFGYREYLQLFILMTPKEDKSYRAMDLIQENLRKTYKSTFRVNRCVWGISYQVNKKEYGYAYNE